MTGLSALARALLSEDLGGRDEVPRHVADRVTVESERWAAHGFTAETIGPWTDLPPAAAAYLAERRVDPRVLDLPMGVARAAAPVALKLAIASGLLPVEQAYELLVATGEHLPTAERSESVRSRPTPVAATSPLNSPVQPLPPPISGKPTRPVSLVVFSHAADDQRPASNAS